jgi:hypothetical protein
VKKGTERRQTTQELPAHGPIAYARAEHPAAQRQAPSPHDATLNRSAAAWMAELPEQVVPLALAFQFPRIVNRLSRFWDSPRMLDRYFEELLLDQRGRRKGFPEKILIELRALAEHHRALHETPTTDIWESTPYYKAGR